MKDVNLYSIAGQRPIGTLTLGNFLADPKVNADALKITDSACGIVRVGVVAGGYEDCLDVNNHTRDVVVEATEWRPQGDYLATIKGGSVNIELRGPVYGHGKVVDIDIGNVADQSDDLTGPVYLNLKHATGDVITVRVLGGLRPVFLNGAEQRYSIVFEVPGPFKSLFLKIYKQLKKLLGI